MSHTQNIHATFVLQGLFDDDLRLLGDVGQQPLHGGGIELLHHGHLRLLCDRLDLRSQRENISVLRLLTDTGAHYDPKSQLH